ncbi:MAG: discoidin domain-containing protein [Bacteroidetes bacterium]|nr:discoidin domain-containing protein [Bacteroidota bacterium]
MNFIAIKNDLQQKGLLNLAKDFKNATGKFALLLYKEEIERALKTPGFSGFQLLDLHDFPGQSTALVGILNPFWESKGFTTPEEHRRWCSEMVPLIRYTKAVYTNNETFDASIEVANFYKPLKNVVLEVEIFIGSEKLYHSEIKATEILVGNGQNLGSISYPLSGIKKAAKIKVSVSIKETAYKNDWDIFVYPENINYPEVNVPEGVFVTRSFSEAEAWLKEGKTVLLNPPLNAMKGITGKFVPVFWSPVHFPNQPGTMGILCNPSHPALKDFPTDYHSNWQWWDLNINSKVVNADTLGGQPILTVIDNFFRNRNLSVLLEGKAGNGKLMFCTIDLNTDIENRPAARQLLLSLLNYMNSKAFNPSSSIDLEKLMHINVLKINSISKILDCSSHDSSYPPEAALDGDKNTFWHTAWGQNIKNHPHHIAFELAKETEIAGFTYVPRQDNNPNGFVARYEFYVGYDAKNWGTPISSGTFEFSTQPQTVHFKTSVKAKYIKFNVLEGFDTQPFASVAELELILANK